MQTYRKVATIQAFQWDGTTQTLLANIPSADRRRFVTSINIDNEDPKHLIYLDMAADSATPQYKDAFNRPKCIIQTLEGPLYVNKGDYIARGIEGEYWAIKPDIFAKTYQATNEVAQ